MLMMEIKEKEFKSLRSARASTCNGLKQCARFCCFLLFLAILYLYPSEFTYNRQPALMIPGFSGLPVLYLYFSRRFVLKLNMMMTMMINSPCWMVPAVRSGAVSTTALVEEEDRGDESAQDAGGGHKTAPEEEWIGTGAAWIAQFHVVLSHLEIHEETDRSSNQHR